MVGYTVVKRDPPDHALYKSFAQRAPLPASTVNFAIVGTRLKGAVDIRSNRYARFVPKLKGDGQVSTRLSLKR